MTTLHGCGTARVDRPSRNGLGCICSAARFMRLAKYAYVVVSKSFLLWWQASRLRYQECSRDGCLHNKSSTAAENAASCRGLFRERDRVQLRPRDLPALLQSG